MEHLGYNFSYHRPIFLNFGSSYRVARDRNRGFRFEPFWLKENDISEVIKSAWVDKRPPRNPKELRVKLHWCASKLVGWSKERFGSLRKSIDDKQKLIESLYARSNEHSVIDQIKRLEWDLEGLLEREEVYWRQRTRADWLTAGDRNSKFFHNRATIRKKKNSIHRLVDNNGEVQESEEGIARIIGSYYASLFQSSNPSTIDISKATETIENRLDNSMQLSLEADFSAEEVKMAVFDMNPTKALGQDGFQAIFFQKFWNVTGPEVTAVYLNILNNGASIREFNNTNIALIPKTKKPSSIKDFRPISLCSVVYKIVIKAMANRLKEHLPTIISPNQLAFIPGRLIFDNVLVSFEILHSISHRKEGKSGHMALKLYMSKAYDRVE